MHSYRLSEVYGERAPGVYHLSDQPRYPYQTETTTYTVAVRTIDTTASDPGFTVVEKTVWYGGRWSNTDSIETLVMDSSGTSGALRFRNGAEEEFIVTLGIHNHNVWCDVVTDLAPGDTGLMIHTEYYTAGPRKSNWTQLAEVQKTSAQGTTVDVKFVTQEGNELVVHITIS
ncbi:lectin 2b [Suillus placidus]|uniref:Lectin 2b n=1 Tax=Suillus placidus TaxID=48579 RepID=A0A9P6ZLY4_9AGAM|nr:lectin 2b [Suillus placidus]